MGIDVAALRFLLDTRKNGSAFGKTIQIGHQGIHVWPDLYDYAEGLVKESGLCVSLAELLGGDSNADTLFKNLGATQVDTMDISAYEGAQVIHDLNEPIPKRLHGKYATVYDGGSLEHVFNTSVAVKNLMNMLEVGGTLMIATTANNYLGHGFYQFSPEWAFRTFSEKWGFEIFSCYLVDCDRIYNLVPAVDPAELGKRVETFTTPVPTYLMIAARKIAITAFASYPQQSDYVPQWTDKKFSESPPGKAGKLRSLLPKLFQWR